MKKILSAALALAAMATAAGTASAAVMNVTFVPVTITATLPGNYKSQDLQITTSTDWTLAEARLTLTSGSIYQDGFGDATGLPPNPGFFGFVPTLQFDTYVSAGGLNPPSIAGGAVDIGGASAPTFSNSAINIAWNNTATTDVGTNTYGRFTLSSDANGSITVQAYSANSAATTVTYPVINGLVQVPEPASLGLLGLGLVGLAARRRQA